MNILLAVSGSISCYKAFDLLRLYIKEGHQVRVILTSGAEKFLRPDLFKYLGAEEVYSSQDDFNMEKNQPEVEGQTQVLHVFLGKWADQFVIAPLSANTLADLCSGKASDLLSSLFLAYPQNKPIVAFPAMNTNMLTHPFVQENLSKLGSLSNCLVFPTAKGELICKDEGAGKLLSIEEIKDLSESYVLNKTNKKVLITTGSTMAPLDSVRYLTNASSGKTGYYLAKEALSLGHEVTVVAGKQSTSLLNNLEYHPNFKLIRVVTTVDMKNTVSELFKSCDSYISSAAIGDIHFSLSADEKMKKEDIKSALPIEKSPDILKHVLSLKKEHQKVVGFAAESELTDSVISEKMTRKPVDLLVATKVHNGLTGGQQTAGFQGDGATYRLIKQGSFGQEVNLSKKELAKYILGNA